ncbi:MAG TPA: MBL fold metallo-hydrolase [Acidimicrobiales bacterium]|nr:MBL fold metallo-hydrolase [Acidimicrobiales bacterium]
MRITYFGVRGSCPTSSDQQRRYGGNTSCVLVEVDGEPPLILDMGTGLRALGHHLNVPLVAAGRPLRANALLTHLHYDHVLGTPFFPPMRDPGALLEIYGPAQVPGSLQETMAGMVKPPFFPVHMADFRGELRYHDLGPDDGFALGGIAVTVRTIPHIGNTLGFRIEADGVSVAFLPDHQAPLDRTTVAEAVLDLCHEVDLLIHDSQYTEDEFVELFDWGHSTPAYAVHVATRAGARRLDMFHHDPGHTDRQIDSMVRAARKIAQSVGKVEVTAAKEGTIVELRGA